MEEERAAAVVREANGGVSKLCLQHTRAMHRENKEIDGAGWSLLRLMVTPKYKANHNGCCSILLWGKGSFVSFCFVLNSFTCLLFVESWERVVCVCGLFIFPPLFFFC